MKNNSSKWLSAVKAIDEILKTLYKYCKSLVDSILTERANLSMRIRDNILKKSRGSRRE